MRELALAAVLGFCACEGAPPGRMLDTDAGGLSYQAQLQGFDGTDQLEWNVSTQQAYVRFDGTALTHGSVQVTFADATDSVVLPVAVSAGPPPASTATGQGQPGTWTVRLDFTDATGTLRFTAAPGAR
jgi:hypothetical protein